MWHQFTPNILRTFVIPYTYDSSPFNNKNNNDNNNKRVSSSVACRTQQLTLVHIISIKTGLQRCFSNRIFEYPFLSAHIFPLRNATPLLHNRKCGLTLSRYSLAVILWLANASWSTGILSARAVRTTKKCTRHIATRRDHTTRANIQSRIGWGACGIANTLRPLAPIPPFLHLMMDHDSDYQFADVKSWWKHTDLVRTFKSNVFYMENYKILTAQCASL